MTSVSVIVPNFNYARYLPMCLGSALGQPGVDVRVLLVDNCSDDDSLDVARGIAATDSRLEVRAHEVNIGLIGSLNEGLEWALARDADATMTLSADDALAPGALARVGRVLAAEPDVGLVHGRVLLLQGDEQPPPPSRVRLLQRSGAPWSVSPGATFVEGVCRHGRNPLFDPEVVLRTSLYREVGFYNPALPHTSDLEMWLRAGSRTRVARLAGQEQAYYRIHPAQHSRDYWDAVLPDLQACLAAYESFLSSAPGSMNVDRLRRLAREGLARTALREGVRAYDRGRTGDVSVPELEAFAEQLVPGSGQLPEARALGRRRRLGPHASRAMRLADARGNVDALRRRTEHWWRHVGDNRTSGAR